MNTYNLEKEEEEEEDISLGVIMTNTVIFHIFHIISLFNLSFFHIFLIISQFVMPMHVRVDRR